MNPETLKKLESYAKIASSGKSILAGIISVVLWLGYTSWTAFGADETADKALELATAGAITDEALQGSIKLNTLAQENTLRGQEKLFELMQGMEERLSDDIDNNRQEILEIIKKDNE